MINFVLKPELLPITKTTNVHHFHQFQAKQMKQKQLEQKQKIQDMLAKIQQEELAKQSKDRSMRVSTQKNKRDFQNQEMSKTFFIQPNNPNKNRPNSTKSFNDFYEKNKKWKQNLQSEIMKRRNQKFLEEEKELQEIRKPLSQKQSFSLQNNTTFRPNISSFLHAVDSKGPISGWTERFHEYIKKRLPQEDSQSQFRPTINKKSQIIASRMVGNVEDRLIRFGEFMKVRKHEMVLEQVQKIGKMPGSQKHTTSTDTNQSDFFYKLYKDAQHTNRKNKQRLEKSQYSFKPSISKLPQQLQKKVQQKRQKNPLHSSKKLSTQQTHRLLQLYSKQSENRPYSEAEFQNFLKRNQLLIQRRNLKINQKQKDDLKRQQKEMGECTFLPVLNRKSMKMLQQKIRQEEFEHQVESEISLKEAPEQLFDNLYVVTDKKSNFKEPQQMNDSDNKSEYKYMHQYSGYEESPYEVNNYNNFQMRTPLNLKIQSQKHQQSNYHDISNNSKLFQVSQMDSLQFSAQKSRLQSNHQFSVDTEKRFTTSFKEHEDEIINYELTFSNKKLSHQLENIRQDQFEQGQSKNQHNLQKISTQKEKVQLNKNYPTKSSAQKKYESQIQEKSQTWQDQLQQVKNRLQKLIKPKNQKIDWK